MGIGNIIKNRRTELGFTMKEVADRVGVSEGPVSRWESGDIENMRRDKIAALAKALQISPSVIMGWDDIPQYPNILPVTTRSFPVLGSVACGEPILMEELREVTVSTDAEIKADFILIAKGDSMTGARIHDGDIVFIRKQAEVENGQIAVVAIDDEAVLKRFYRYGELIVLRSENPAYKDIEIRQEDGKSVRVLGKAVKFQSDIE